MIIADVSAAPLQHRKGVCRKGERIGDGVGMYIGKRIGISRVGERLRDTEFVAIDGEGVTLKNGEHRYVLFGVGQDQIVDERGLHWSRILELLESHWHKGVCYSGYYLGYDFTQWLRTLPEDRAWRLLTIKGKERRKSTSVAMHGRYLPVDLDGWQVDMIGQKQMKFRRRVCECPTMKCPHKQNPWIYVCDSGPFFQQSFLATLKKLPDGIVTPDELETVTIGKSKRASAKLDNDMRVYNRLENELHERVMHDLAAAFTKLGIHLTPSQWYGPGQAAQAWLRKSKIITREQLAKIASAEFLDAARKTFYGGWFEIFAHGHIPGTSYEYDIRSAYPDVIRRLPCLAHAVYSQGEGEPPRKGDTRNSYTIVECVARQDYKDRPLGAMLYRNAKGLISRPRYSRGWYWQHEIRAARKAGAVSLEYLQPVRWWRMTILCDCPPPLGAVLGLYNTRVDLGSKSTVGKAAKLMINSLYGKFAQSVGFAPYGNPIYASLITSLTRCKILDAIRTHPSGQDALLMIATDAVFFSRPHPTLPQSADLGDWELVEHERLTLFKPGFYWSDAGRERLASVKSRGLNVDDLRKAIPRIDDQFASLPTGRLLSTDDWPVVKIPVRFAMVSALEALNRRKWSTAGNVQTDNYVTHDSAPYSKRCNVAYDYASRTWRSQPHQTGATGYDTTPYQKRFGYDDPFSDEVKAMGGVMRGEMHGNIYHFLISGED